MSKSKHTIVLLHGLMGTPERDFEFILPALSREFNVIKVCFQGFGRVQNDLLLPPSVDDIVSDLVQNIAKKMLGKPYVLGYCFGGHIALRLALDFPETVRGVFCYGTRIFWDKEDAEHSKNIYKLDRIRHENPSWYSRIQEDHGENLEQVSSISISLSNEMVDVFSSESDKLRNTEIECVFIYGENDDLAIIDEAPIIENVNKCFSCYVLPGASHNTFLVNPMRVMAILTEHIFGNP